MKRSIAVLLLLVAASCARSAPQLDTQTFVLRYLDANAARQLITPYVYSDRPGAPGALSITDRAITVRETHDNLERIAHMLGQFDQPRPLVRLTFHLIQADGASTSDPAIADVESALRKLFRFRGYRLMQEGVFTANEGGTVSQSIGSYELLTEIRRVAGTGDSATVEVMVHLAGNGVRFGTEVGVPAGKTAVLGNIVQDARGTLILTVRPELVSAAP